MQELRDLEDLPKNVSVSKPGITVSEWPIDVLYNPKMEKVRKVMEVIKRKINPIQIVIMKSETVDVDLQEKNTIRSKLARQLNIQTKGVSSAMIAASRFSHLTRIGSFMNDGKMNSDLSPDKRGTLKKTYK
jgi:hypothetical protein